MLRYVHDPLSAEFANVGIVIYSPAKGGEPPFLSVRTRKTIGRLSEMFPGIERASFSSAMRSIDRAIGRISRHLVSEPLLRSDGDATTFARKALPADESALQWSPAGAGLSANPAAVLDKLFDRFVSKYDVRLANRRTDDEVWRPVRARLEARDLAGRLRPKVITGGDDRIEFEHAWKNGRWHVYEAISLDLANADGIRDKAHRWLGQLTSIAKEPTVEQFQPHFLVGAPSNPDLQLAYMRAIKILRKSPFDPEIYEENQIDALVKQIEDEVRAHTRGN
ncbi:MAG TPA: DUF3037 domain-containing protein [Chthoniobacterales bacterium]|nr:DUF3037 domain-containing protein [Chthoniobacterales bacterium]